MVTMGVFPFQGKTHMVEPGIEPGTSWLVDRSSDNQATRLVMTQKVVISLMLFFCGTTGVLTVIDFSFYAFGVAVYLINHLPITLVHIVFDVIKAEGVIGHQIW